MRCARLMAGLLGIVVMLTVLVLLSGCTTASLRLPGGASLLQPKDVTLKGLEYTAPDGSQLKVAEYTSSANVGAIQAQAALTQGLVQTAIQTALKAAAPVAAAEPAPRAPTVGVLAEDGRSIVAVETTTVTPVK